MQVLFARKSQVVRMNDREKRRLEKTRGERAVNRLCILLPRQFLWYSSFALQRCQ
jgi:hypothetical protein